MSTQTDDRGPYEQAYDEAVETLAQAEAAYEEALAGSEEETAAQQAMESAERHRDAARDAYAESDEPRDYDLSDGSGWTETIRCDPSSVEQEWCDWIDGGDWGDGSESVHISGDATDTLTDETHWYTHTIEPQEPPCSAGEVHDWQSPYSVLGGLKENPGVQGHGGGVIITEVCGYCGRYRITDTWAQDPTTGQQGLESVRYDEADEIADAWLWRRVADRASEIECPDGYTVRLDADEQRMRLVREADEASVTLSAEEMHEVIASESWDQMRRQCERA